MKCEKCGTDTPPVVARPPFDDPSYLRQMADRSDNLNIPVMHEHAERLRAIAANMEKLAQAFVDASVRATDSAPKMDLPPPSDENFRLAGLGDDADGLRPGLEMALRFLRDNGFPAIAALLEAATLDDAPKGRIP